MPSAGELKDRLHFQQRALDANNDRTGEWDVSGQATRWAKVVWLKGSEPVMAQRLQSIQPVVITVRDDSVTRAFGTAWRAVGKNGFLAGKPFNIRGVSPSKAAGFLDILAETDGGGGG
ncbi:MAG: head-tail adaptor protein [Hyphomicrobiales bacterium]|nr:MAG: head-tail adaptor protein [Hyphomicrobiales bacterium]